MKNEFLFEGTATNVETKTSSRGNTYWIVVLECGKDSCPFVFFKDEPVKDGMYRVWGHLGMNDKGYSQISVDKTDVLRMPASRPASQQQPSQGPEMDDETPF